MANKSRSSRDANQPQCKIRGCRISQRRKVCALKRRISRKTRRKTVNPESSYGRRKRTKKSSAISLKKFTNLRNVQFIVTRNRVDCVICDRREQPSLKNFLKSSSSDELARPKAQRMWTLYDRIVTDPAATFRFHRRFIALNNSSLDYYTVIFFRCSFLPECVARRPRRDANIKSFTSHPRQHHSETCRRLRG